MGNNKILKNFLNYQSYKMSFGSIKRLLKNVIKTVM